VKVKCSNKLTELWPVTVTVQSQFISVYWHSSL